MATNKMNIRQYSQREELANALTHGLGILLGVVGLTLLVVFAALRGDAWHIVTASVYGASLVLLYTASTLYHSFRKPSIKRALRVFDHCSIYLLIAGTYTPFMLVFLRDTVWGWSLLGVIWSLALAGIVFKVFFTGRFRLISTLVYVAMGWAAAFAIQPMLERIPTHALLWLLIGGLIYSGGSILYLWKKIPYNHALWHLCVLAGSICHFIAVFEYVIP